MQRQRFAEIAGIWRLLLAAGCSWSAGSPALASVEERGEETPAAAISASPAASLEGTITFDGEVPRSSVPDDSGFRRDLLQVDSNTRGLQHVLVFLEPDAPKSGSNDIDEAPLKPVIIDQVDHTFTPHVTAVRAGQAVLFTNSDPANHNVRASSMQRENEFNIYVAHGGEYRHRFAADQRHRPVQLGCDIHPWMRGWVYVFDHPLYAVTDEQGKYRIASAPPGRYRVQVRQPDVNYRVERIIEIEPDKAARLDIQIKREELKR